MGLWIDHSKAVIVSILDKKESIVMLESNLRKRFRSAPGKRDGSPNGRRNMTPDDIRDRGFKEHLNLFYKRVISYLRGSDSILIIGPGQTRGEFAKILLGSSLSERVVGIETADKMTDRQIVAKIRKYFQGHTPVAGAKSAKGRAKPAFAV